MLRPQHFTHYKNDRNYFANDKSFTPKQFNVVQPQQQFKYGIPHNAQVPKFKFGIPQNKNIKLPITQQQVGYKPQFGYRPQVNHNQPQFGYRPQLNLFFFFLTGRNPLTDRTRR
jgi:hypothetical protein